MTTPLAGFIGEIEEYIVLQNGIHYAFTELTLPFMMQTVVFGFISAATMVALCSLLLKSAFAFALAITILYAVIATQWALQLRSIKNMLSGSGIGVSLAELNERMGANLVGDEQQQLVLVADGLANSIFPPLVTESTLFGASIFMFCAATYSVVVKSTKSWRSTSIMGRFVRCTIFVMFAVSFTHWVTLLIFWTTLLRGSKATTSYNNRLLLITFECWAQLFAVNICLSDSIVLWRMCVLWTKKRGLIIVSGILIAATLALSIANVVSSVTSVLNSGAQVSDPTFMVQALPILGKASPFWIAELCLSWSTNAFATSMIAIKAWQYRKRVGAYLSDGGTGTKLAEKFMALLVESGTLYVCIWTAFTVTSLAFVPGSNSGNKVTVLDHWDLAMAQITFIFPAAIIIIVTLERAHCNRGITYQTKTNVASTTVELDRVVNITNAASSFDSESISRTVDRQPIDPSKEAPQIDWLPPMAV